jgi:hypothetical protein
MGERKTSRGREKTAACMKVLLFILAFVMVRSFLLHGTSMPLYTATELCNSAGVVDSAHRLFGGVDFTLSFPVYYINMDGSEDRRKQTELLFGDLWDLRRSPAVAGTDSETLLRLLGTETYQRVASYIQRERNGDEAMAWNEAACTLSHLTTIRQAYLENHEMVMIMEDDVSPALM